MKDKERAKRYSQRAYPWWGVVPASRTALEAAYVAGLRMGRKLEREAK